MLHGSVGIRTPLLPAAQEQLDLRIACQFQGKRLDRGASPGLSAGHGGLIRGYPPLAEDLPQRFWRFETPVFGQQFLPLEAFRASDMSAERPMRFLSRQL